MNILFLTNNMDTTKPLLDFLIQREAPSRVDPFDKPITADMFGVGADFERVDFIISYNYTRLIGADVLRLFDGRIINLHISLLPWNRGISPLFWSCFEDTPKGVTIHRISEGLDKGEILLQKEVSIITNSETFRTAYDKMHMEIQALLIKHWESLRVGDIMPRIQQGGGSYHSREHIQRMISKHNINWDENIAVCMDRIRRHKD